MPRRGRTPAKTLDFRPSISREEFDAVREYVNEFNALGPAATYSHVRKAGQRVRRQRFRVLRKWMHIIRNQYKWFLCSDLGYRGLDYSPEQHLRKTIPSEGRRVAAAIQKVQAAREVLCTLDEHFKVLDAIDKFLCLSRQQRAECQASQVNPFARGRVLSHLRPHELKAERERLCTFLDGAAHGLTTLGIFVEMGVIDSHLRQQRGQWKGGRRRASTRRSWLLPLSKDQLKAAAVDMRQADPQLTKAECARRLAAQMYSAKSREYQQRLARNVIRHHL